MIVQTGTTKRLVADLFRNEQLAKQTLVYLKLQMVAEVERVEVSYEFKEENNLN